MPLHWARAGDVVTVRDVRGGPCLKRRMAELGFTRGTPLRVVRAGGCGPFILVVRDSRVAVGQGLARKLWVERQVA